MILFLEDGRLGNQIFQYVALRNLATPHEQLVLIGFDELAATFDGIEATFVQRDSAVARLMLRNRAAIDASVRRLPGIGIIEESAATAVPDRVRPGRIAYARTGYFQSELAADGDAAAKLRLKSGPQVAAEDLLDRHGEEGTNLFVHIRRGDYVQWPSRAHPAVLSARWYLDAMDLLRDDRPRVRFFVVTDDPHHARDILGLKPEVVISGLDAPGDLALMAACDGGIASPSSLSWWGAWLARRRDPNVRLVAPKYWAGHRIGQWYPRYIQSSFIEYI